MVYYRRYLLYYFLLAFAEAGLWLLLVGTIYQPGVVFLIVAVFATAILCNLLGFSRYRRSVNQMLESADTASFLKTNSRCIRSGIKKARPILQINQVYALMLEGRFDEAGQLLGQIQMSQRGKKRNLLNEQIAYAMRGAGLAICLNQFEEARAKLEQMRQKLCEFSSEDAFFIHYQKGLQDLTAQLAVREGGGKAYLAYFENQVKSSRDRVPQSTGYFYLGLAQENAGDAAGALASYRMAQQLTPNLWLGHTASERAARLQQGN